LAPAWAAELLPALRRGADGAARLDAAAVAAAAADVPLAPCSCEELLQVAAHARTGAPNLLPLLLRRGGSGGGGGGGGVALAALVSPHVVDASCRAWLRTRVASAAHAPVACLFASLRLFESLALGDAADGGAADTDGVLAPLHAEALDVASRLGLAAVLSGVAGLSCAHDSGEGAAALRIVRALAGMLTTTAQARDAMAGLAGPASAAAAPAAPQLWSPLAAAAAVSVLDRFGDGWSLEAPPRSAAAAAATPPPLLRDVLLHAGGFWSFVLGARGAHCDALLSHPAARRVAGLASSFAAGVRLQSVSVGSFRVVTDGAGRGALLALLRALQPEHDHGALLDAAEARLRAMEAQLAPLAWFLELCALGSECAAERAALDAAVADVPDCSLAALGGDAFWSAGLGAELRGAAAALAPLRGSALLAAAWRTQMAAARAAGERAGVRAGFDALPSAEEGDEEEAEEEEEEEEGDAASAHEPTSSTPVALLSVPAVLSQVVPAVRVQLLDLWARPTLTNRDLDAIGLCLPAATPSGGDAADAEAALLSAFAERQQARGNERAFAAKLRAYARRGDMVALAAHVEAFCGAFSLPPHAGALGGAFAAVATAAALPGTSLAALGDAIGAASEATRGLEPAMDAVRVLGTAQGGVLIDFLRNSDDDLRNLINAVEARGARHVRADTVDDLIRVKRALGDALAANAATPEGVMRVLLPVVADASMLGRIANCCEHVHGLIRLYKGLADRHGQMQSTVGDLVAHGVFHFTAPGDARCRVSAALGEALTLSELELHTMQEHAVLMQHDSARIARGDDVDDDGGGAPSVVEQFLAWMEHVSTIREAVTELRVLGFVIFRHYEAEASGDDLEDLAAGMVATVADWRAELAAARQRNIFLTFFNGPQLWLLSDALLTRTASARQQASASLLLQYVHPAARLPVTAGRAANISVDATVWLTDLGSLLNAVLARLAPASEEAPAASLAVCPPGVITVIACAAAAAVTALVGLFAAASPAPPRRCQLLLCDAATTSEEVEAFLVRAAMSPDSPLFRHMLFVIAHVERLPEAVHLHLVERLPSLQREHAGGAWRLALLCDGSRRQHLLDEFGGQVIQDCARLPWWPASPADMAAKLSADGRAVTVVTSEHPGLGKTAFVAAQQRGADGADGGDAPLKSLLLSGEVSRERVVARLLALDLRPGDALHVQLCDARDAPATHSLLLELTQLRTVLGAAAVVHLAGVSRFFIEVANPSTGSVEDVLARLPLLAAFECHECVFELDDVRVGATLDASLELHTVCLYLHLLETGAADTHSYRDLLTGDTVEFIHPDLQLVAAPLSPARCRELLAKNFLNTLAEHSPPSYAALSVFIRVLAAQLQRFTDSFQMCTFLEIPGRFRSCVLLALVAMARDFAQQSVSAAREMQANNVQQASSLTAAEAAVAACVRRMDTIVRWDGAKTLLLLDADGAVITLRIVQEALRQPIESEGRGLALEACDVASTSKEVMLDRLYRMVQVNKTAAKLPLVPGYVLTPDVVLKMAMIYLRILSGTPVVILGETGA
jgi:hypothetical protein